MKRFFRERKTSISSSSKPVVSAPAPLSSKEPEPPLYARFSTVHRRPSQDGPNKPVVSAPMQLSSRASRGSIARSVKSNGTGGGSQTRSSKVLKRMPSRQEQIEQKVLASPPPRSSSRLSPPAPNLSGIAVESHKLDISAVLHPESSQLLPREREERPADEGRRRSVAPGYSSQPADERASRFNPPESSDSESTRSSFPSPYPPRQLVVRNADPDISNITSELSSDVSGGITGYASLSHTSPSTPSQPIYHGRPEVTGFPFPAEPRPAPTEFVRDEGTSSAVPPLSMTASSSSPSSRYARIGVFNGTQPSQYARDHSPSVSGPVSLPTKTSPPAVLLQSNPSINRKKYSPTAAFGSPVPHPNNSYASPMATTSTQMNQVPSVDTRVHTPNANDNTTYYPPQSSPPTLTPLPRPAPNYSRPNERIGMLYEPAVAAPSSNMEDGIYRKQSRQEIPVQGYDRYPRPRGSEQATHTTRKASQSRHQQPSNVLHNVIQPSPYVSSPPPAAASVLDRSGHPDQSFQHRVRTTSANYTNAPGQPQQETSHHIMPSRHNSTASTSNGPVRGRPLIFQAMETTSEIHDVEPGIVGMIGSASAQAKTEEGYTAYAYGGRQTSKPLPEPNPSQADKPGPRKKPSKLHKTPSHSKIDPVRAMVHAIEKRHSAAFSDTPDEAKTAEADALHHNHFLHRKHSSTVGAQPDPRRLSRDMAPPVEHQESYPDHGRHDRPVPRDSAIARRGRDGVRHLTEKQRGMLYHRASYVDPAQQRPPYVDPRNRAVGYQPAQQYGQPIPSIPHPPHPHLPPPPLPATSPILYGPAASLSPPPQVPVPPSFVPVPEATRPEASVVYNQYNQAPVPQSSYIQPPPPYTDPPQLPVANVPQYNYVPSDRPPSMYKQETPPAPGPSETRQSTPQYSYVPSDRPTSMYKQGTPPAPSPSEVRQFVPPVQEPSLAQTPAPPEESSSAQPRRRTTKRKDKARVAAADVKEKVRDTKRAYTPTAPTFYPLVRHLREPALLENLLTYLSFYEWTNLCAISKQIRHVLFVEGKDQVLERYLRTVGYSKWGWGQPEPLVLTIKDLCDYMRGVSIPSYKYASIANSYLQSQNAVEPSTIHELITSCRAFTRVVLRLRCQAEAEAAHNARMALYNTPSTSSLPAAARRTPSNSKYPGRTETASRSSSRAPSPSSSNTFLPGTAHSRSNTMTSGRQRNGGNSKFSSFQSPLFRLRRAPLLQVFVPSPDGEWLSDQSVLKCESELNRAGVMHLLRAGDVVWDVAAGDEGNVGRLVWDGNYLIDLDYTYSRVGDPPRYLPSLAFPPSYFHRIIRTMGTGNPVVRIDVSPWGEEILANIKLLQDRIRTETPQGGYHTVVRWVHRSSFTIRAPRGSKSIRLPMPNTAGAGPSPTGAWVIDPDWFGTVVVETEGTNEGQEDLQERCRPARNAGPGAEVDDSKVVWRILRERSRPGEIWIRAVSNKERLIPA